VIVFAVRSSRGLARRLNGRQQERDEDRDHRNDHQQLNQCESDSSIVRPHWHSAGGVIDPAVMQSARRRQLSQFPRSFLARATVSGEFLASRGEQLSEE
jgi:hypothetical protein